MRLRQVTPAYRDRLLDAMALLLVDLHRGGVYWGDCSLANTLFRRDGDRIQAYLVDAETSEVHPALSDGQRRFDLDILVENVAFGLADLALYQGRPDEADAAIEAAESVRARYEAVWSELHDQPDLIPGDRRAIRARLRRLNDLGFSVDLEVDPVGPAGTVRLRTSVTTRRYHANELERRTRLRDPRGAGADPAQRPRRVPRLARVVRAPPDRRRRGRRPLAARGLPADARPDRRVRRAGPGPRPGVLRRPRAQVAAVRAGRARRRPRRGDRVVRRRGGPGARAARGRHRERRSGGAGRARRGGRRPRPGRADHLTAAGGRVPGLSARPSAPVNRTSSSGRRPPWRSGAVSTLGSAG